MVFCERRKENVMEYQIPAVHLLCQKYIDTCAQI